MKATTLGLPILFALALIPSAMNLAAADRVLDLNLRSRDSSGRAVEKRVEWPAAKTALIICDMWDDHWCRSAARRVAELAGPLNATVKAARARGVFIVHAPSTCMEYYRETPQRKRAQAAAYSSPPTPIAPTPRWGTTWCWTDAKREGVLPIDDSDMGCDCAEKCVIRDAWSRQNATIEIGAADAITDNGQEIWNLLVANHRDHILLCGVHLNMCVLGRPFAIRQMVYWGKDVALIRDLTDTMYNPQRPPGVSHFAGTDLVVAHVEKFWCPTLTSSQLSGLPAFRFQGAP